MSVPLGSPSRKKRRLRALAGLSSSLAGPVERQDSCLYIPVGSALGGLWLMIMSCPPLRLATIVMRSRWSRESGFHPRAASSGEERRSPRRLMSAHHVLAIAHMSTSVSLPSKSHWPRMASMCSASIGGRGG